MNPERAPISGREREVLALLGDHLTHEEIARRLFISVRTVESHVASLRRKLGLPDHRALVRFAAGPARAEGWDRPRRAQFAPLTSFVGRADDLAAMVDALRAARVVTAVGPGGVGKTRLALAAADALRPTVEEVRCMDLVAVSDPARLEHTVAQVCDAPVSSLLGPVDALALAFGGRSVLLVLDNAEHVLDAVAVLVERLVGMCPGVRVLLTSRARLALPVERVFRVEGLSPGADGDAVALFVERATAAGSDPPQPEQRTRIAAVCSALGGLALAVELAAVRMPVLGLEGVERALLDQAVLLSGGSSLHPRHRSMHETLDWSVALLEPASARLLARLAVFVAPFELDAADAVAGFPPLTPDAVRRGLVQLVEHNLLATTTQGGSLVHRMLEPVRQYAAGRLDVADDAVHARHLAWCSRVVRALLAEPDADPGEALRDPVPDARAALVWAAARPDSGQPAARLAHDLALLLYRDGSLDEAQRLFEQAAGLDSDAGAAVDDLARAAAVAKCRVLGDEALRIEVAAADRARAADDLSGAACALARAVELMNRFPGMFRHPPSRSASRALADTARELAVGSARAGATLTVATSGYAATAGAPTRDSALAALDAARSVGDHVLESSALDALAAAALFTGDVAEAHRIAQRRLVRVAGWRDDPAVGLELKDALHVATFCALAAGDLPAATSAALRHQELPFLRERRDLADDELAAPAALAGDWAAAVGTGERFLADWTAAGRPVAPGRGLAPAAVALAHGLLGDEEARAAWLDVLARIRGVPLQDANRGSGFGELFEALVHLHEGRPEAASDALAEADSGGLYARVFGPWIAAARAEAAVLARSPAAPALLAAAVAATRGNPVAAAMTARAAALRSDDRAALAPLADALQRAGATYQAERTRMLGRAP